MKIYTKRGDNGQSDLLGGQRSNKDDLRFNALGDLDELNAWIGLMKCSMGTDEKDFLEHIQKDLGIMMEHVASLGGKALNQHPFPIGLDKALETRIDAISTGEDMFQFVLPGVNETSARINVARTIARRAERSLCTVGWEYNMVVEVLKYINRLSDYLFVLMVCEAKKGDNK